MAHVLDEKKVTSLARMLEEKKKESVDRDHYDKALVDRLSIVAEGVAGNFCRLCSQSFFALFVRIMLVTFVNHLQVCLAYPLTARLLFGWILCRMLPQM